VGYQIDMQWDANKLPGAEQALLRQSCIRWSRRSPPAPEPKDCCQGVVGDGIVASESIKWVAEWTAALLAEHGGYVSVSICAR